MSGNICRIEVSPPKHRPETLRARLERFAARFRQTVAAGHIACITDNAMGRLAFQGHELIAALDPPAGGGQVMLHLNAFHTVTDLHETLDAAHAQGVKELLIVSGDGSARLPRLTPAGIGCDGEVVTSVELLGYIRRRCGNAFRLGAAFNQYEPEDHEWEKLRRKLDAGADFLVTQPVVGTQPVIERLLARVRVPVILEAWMSPRIDLLSECIGFSVAEAGEGAFDPLATLAALRQRYPENDFYLALLDHRRQFPRLAELGFAPGGRLCAS